MEIIDKLNLKKVINASGKMTTLGTSTLSKGVVDYCNYGYENFFVMDELHNNCNSYLAEQLGVEAACITASTSSAITLVLASMLTKDNIVKIENLYDFPKGRVVVQKGHCVNFGTTIKTLVNCANCELIEVGSVNKISENHLRMEIDDRTTCGLFVKSHHCVQKSMLDFLSFTKVCHEQGIPVIVDASAEEDLFYYYQNGADVVMYSGAKAICGPTSGLCIGKDEYIKNIMPQYKGIGRAMKVGKEALLGLTKAVEEYLDQLPTGAIQEAKCDQLISGIMVNEIFTASKSWDKAGRDIIRVKLSSSVELSSELIEYFDGQNPIVVTRLHELNLGIIEFDMRSVDNKGVEQISEYINEFIRNKEEE